MSVHTFCKQGWIFTFLGVRMSKLLWEDKIKVRKFDFKTLRVYSFHYTDSELELCRIFIKLLNIL